VASKGRELYVRLDRVLDANLHWFAVSTVNLFFKLTYIHIVSRFCPPVAMGDSLIRLRVLPPVIKTDSALIEHDSFFRYN